AVEEERLEQSPIWKLKRVATEAPKERALATEAELRGFFAAIDAISCAEPMKVALQLVLATAARPGEVAAMRWSEIDSENAIWVLPKERDKMHKMRRIALSQFAVELLDQAREFNVDKDIVFPSGRAGRSPQNEGLSRTVGENRRVFADNGVEPFSPHDLRRSARSLLAHLEVPNHVAERCLGH